MLEDCRRLGSDERFKHLDVLEKYSKSLNTGLSDKTRRWFAVRSFYEHHRLSLPKSTGSELSKFLRPSEADKLL